MAVQSFSAAFVIPILNSDDNYFYYDDITQSVYSSIVADG